MKSMREQDPRATGNASCAFRISGNFFVSSCSTSNLQCGWRRVGAVALELFLLRSRPSHYSMPGPTSFFIVFTFVRSSSGSSIGVSAINAACAVRGAFSKRRNGSNPIDPLPMC
jgi:hypothetical protein